MEGFEWRHLDFPERDVLDLRVTHAGKETKLMTYRWPATGERKAVVFMLHGYSSCAPHMAVLAKFLAADGFEVFAFDMGERGGFLSTEQVYSDCWALVFEVCKQFAIDQQALAPTSVAQTSLPLCFIKAEKDGVVRNDYIEDVAAKGTNPLNEMHEVPGADHTDICFDEHYGSHTIRATLAFLNKLQTAR
mgnify:CR=1 FL=1